MIGAFPFLISSCVWSFVCRSIGTLLNSHSYRSRHAIMPVFLSILTLAQVSKAAAQYSIPMQYLMLFALQHCQARCGGSPMKGKEPGGHFMRAKLKTLP